LVNILNPYRISKINKIYKAPISEHTREDAFVKVTPKDIEEFPYFLKIWVLLTR